MPRTAPRSLQNGIEPRIMRYQQLETQLKELVGIVSPSMWVVQQVEHYIEHGEYGLALEWVGIGMHDRGRTPSQTEVAKFCELAKAMKLDAQAELSNAVEAAKLNTVQRQGVDSE